MTYLILWIRARNDFTQKKSYLVCKDNNLSLLSVIINIKNIITI